MDLDQLKHDWQAEQDQQLNQQKLNQNQLERMMNNIENNLQQIQQKNSYWYTSTVNINKVIAAIWLLLVVLYLALPHRASHLNLNLLIHFSFSLLVAAVGIWSVKRQKEIFNTVDGENLAVTLRRTIKDFKRFYLVINLQMALLLPACLYLFIPYELFPGTYLKLFCYLAITIIVMALNHWYYRQAYFKRITQMQQNLNELSATR